ncbi:hypothetical protein [Paenibacillus terrigena]|uniref:hypothetical protein n=1 Tax=Paenibacillus terrigena TaxID=369333 RepID=UPI0028D7A9A1|nr:hypothetical protein [Paenibacillus terrigena]
MINKRNFLLGLGSGLILGGVLLQLMLSAPPVKPKNTNQDLSSFTMEQLEAEAKNLNMQLVPVDSKVYSVAQLQELFKKKEAEWRATLPPVEPVGKQPGVKGTSESLSTSEKNAEASIKAFKVSAGMTLIQVGDKLEDLGIVDSSAKFVAYGKKHGINSKIRTGTYELSADQTYAEIAKEITTKP